MKIRHLKKVAQYCFLENNPVCTKQELRRAVHSSTGKVLINSEKWEKGIKYCSIALNLGCDDVSTVEALAFGLIMLKAHVPAAQLMHTLFLHHFGKEEYLSAVDYIEKAIALDRSSAAYWVDNSLCLNAMEDYYGARTSALQAVTLDPRNSLAHFNLGLANKGIGNVDLAVEEFRKALAIEPEWEAARAHYRSCLVSQTEANRN